MTNRDREGREKETRAQPNQRDQRIKGNTQKITYKTATTTLCIRTTLASGMNNILKRLIRFSCDNGKQNREQGE